MNPEEIQQFIRVVGHEPTAFQNSMYMRLKQVINREPHDNEVGNMLTDAGLILLVLSGQ